MVKPLPPFDPAQAAPFMLRHGHSAKLGLEYHDHGADWVALKLPWRDDLVGEVERGILASGPIISLLDMASGLAIWTRHGAFLPIATLDLRVDYQRPANKGAAVIGRAECYQLSKSAAFVRGTAYDVAADRNAADRNGDDRSGTVATMSAVFMSIAVDARNG